MTDGPLADRGKLNLSPAAMRQWMFDESGGGIAISGDSGSGKSVLMRQLLRNAIDRGESAVFLFDPHGDLAREVLRDALDMGESVRRRTYLFAPGDENVPIGPLDPLRVRRYPGITPYALAARQDVKVLHAALLMLAAWGDENFDQKPQLFKWATLVLRSLQSLGLPLADSLHFLDFGSDLYRRLVREVPHEYIRREFQQLDSLRPIDREQMTASTKNRFEGVFRNAVLNAHFGVAGRTVDVRKFIEERAVVLVDLSLLGMLHDQFHQLIMANFWLGELLHDVFATPAADRLPVLIACDELPVFRLSSPLIVRALTQVRKMKTRLILSFQGTHSFPLGKDDRLLRATAQCGTRFYFRHGDEDDAKYFGGMAALPHFDPTMVKFEYWDKEQYQVGHEVVSLIDRSVNDTYGDGETHGTSSGVKQDKNWSTSQSAAVANQKGSSDALGKSRQNTTAHGEHEAQSHASSQQSDEDRLISGYNDAVANAAGKSFNESDMHGISETQTASRSQTHTNTRQEGAGGAYGTHEDESHARSTTTQHGEGHTIKQQLVPILDWREVLRFKEFLSRDDQIGLAASLIARQQNGQAVMQIAGRGSAAITVPMPKDELEDTPKFAAKLVQRFIERMKELPFCYHAPSLYAYRTELPAAFLGMLRERREAEPKRAPPGDDTGIGI